MALNPSSFIVVLLLAAPFVAQASDPDISIDFVLPQGVNATETDGDFFTFSGMRALLHAIANGSEPDTFTVVKASIAEFPALTGQSVSYAALTYPSMSVNPPHLHPRASELLFVVEGTLFVGLVDATSTLHTQTLEEGDMFVFPKGLTHFQFNVGSGQANAFSAFGSANAGTVSIPGSLFGSAGIDDGVLAKSFKTDAATVQKIKAGLATKA